jgi:hypothetical protein
VIRIFSRRSQSARGPQGQRSVAQESAEVTAAGSLLSIDKSLDASPQLDPFQKLASWATQNGAPVIRWSATEMPLSISIQPFPEEACPLKSKPLFHQGAQLNAILKSVLDEWHRASLGQIQFRPLQNTTDKPQIVIEWSQEPVKGRVFEVGHTRRILKPALPEGFKAGRSTQYIESVQITLLTHPVIDDYLTLNQQCHRLRTTLLHEIGHALGLEHSPNPVAVMHHRGWQNPTLSLHDAQALQAIYRPEAKSGLYI